MNRKYTIAGFLLALMTLWLAPLTLNAQANDVVWNLQFYSNPYLIGDSARTATWNGPLTLDWGTTSPGDGVPDNGFSMRAGSNPYFAAGTYRFNVLADDGVSVTVDDQMLVNTYDNGQPAVQLTADVTLTEGNHRVQVNYREAEGLAYVFVNWGIGNNAPINFVQASGAIFTQGRWTTEFYNNTTLTPPIAFANETPSPVADWHMDSPVQQVNADGWSARFRTSFYLDAGVYRATLRADDGVRYYVNGRLLIDQFGMAKGNPFTVDFEVGSGEQTFVIEHVEYGGNAFLEYNLVRLLGVQNVIYIGANPGPQAALGSVATATPVPLTGDFVATVNTARLNVRSQPRVARGNVLTIVSREQQYRAIGRANNGWIQLDVNGVIGWVSGTTIRLDNRRGLPITGEGPTS